MKIPWTGFSGEASCSVTQMKYQIIPNTVLNPSVICLGGLPFGVNLDEPTSFALMDTFFEGGGNFIDTALVYGEWLPGGKGLSEKTIGKWLAARGNREKVILGTKGAHPRLASMDRQRLAPVEIVSDLDESLHNLSTDYIDLYWLHRDDPSRPVAGIITTLNEQVRAGKIRYFGCSNWRLDRILEAQQFAIENGLAPFAANQIKWSLAVPNPGASFDPNMVWLDEPLKDYHRQSGLAVAAYTSQARGFFTRLARSGPEGLPESLKKSYFNDLNLSKMARLQEAAKETGHSVGEIALSYIVSQPFPAFAIAGCSDRAQLEEILRAGDIRLGKNLLDYLDSSG